MTTPSAAAITANRLCSHGSNDRAAPVATRRSVDTSLPSPFAEATGDRSARSMRSHAPIATQALPMISG
jgi:hypothetical protein